MKQLFSLALLAVLAGCTTISQAAPRQDGIAGLGESTHVDGPLVTPLRLIEDSRCPINARCVWAGRVVLRVRVAGNRTMELTLGEPQEVADGALTLVAVAPDRIAGEGQDIAPADYRFTFAFDGGY
ncbi:hypothetical protein [Parasphingopyxis lamellibrachiae]|uniref:Lipoprotein n=1 Tax=Parasphingopyxis lamellibrachiae TaxID=680125 RepID=A0A3D9FCT7_9SPHN|nr:hypothetical protein [Parasphingopyxis lamellibrachiae]RED15357.1 hypothetical protein DFR46_0348 [Parasphingopyxis lamellibrachiae]